MSLQASHYDLCLNRMDSEKFEQMINRHVPKWKQDLIEKHRFFSWLFDYRIWSRPNHNGKPGEYIYLTKRGKHVACFLTEQY